MSNLSSTDSSAVSLLRLEKVGTCTALHWKRRRKDGFNVFTNQSILHTYLQISRDFAIYSVNYVSARILAEIADRIPDRRSKDENTEKYKRLSPDVFHKLYINTRDVLRGGEGLSTPGSMNKLLSAPLIYKILSMNVYSKIKLFLLFEKSGCLAASLLLKPLLNI